MRNVDQSNPIWVAWNGGGVLAGDRRPHSRVTVEPGWTLQTGTLTTPTYTSNALDGPHARAIQNPVRWFQRSDNSQTELEIPNVRKIDMTYSVDQDAATCAITILNTITPEFGSNIEKFGEAGYLSPDRAVGYLNPVTTGADSGSAANNNRWGFKVNEWSQVLGTNALIRTYQGYGGNDLSIGEAINEGHLVQTGLWLVDNTQIVTGGQLILNCRNMAKLVVDQEIYPPLVPDIVYGGGLGLSYDRYFVTYLNNASAQYGVDGGQANVALAITGVAGSATTRDTGGYWLVGNDGNVFAYGLVSYFGSKGMGTPSAGVLRNPQQNEVTSYTSWNGVGHSPNGTGVVAICATQTGSGYWLLEDNGYITSFGYQDEDAGEGTVDSELTEVGTLLGWPTGYAWPVANINGPSFFDYVAIERYDAAINSMWLFRANGNCYAYGSATWHGNAVFDTTVASNVRLLGGPRAGTSDAEFIVDAAAVPGGDGYYMLSNHGNVWAFGAAVARGGLSIVGGVLQTSGWASAICPTPANDGYYILTQDGQVYTFGAAPYLGAFPTNLTLPSFMVDMFLVTDADNPNTVTGYYLIAEDGGVFPEGVPTRPPFLGSLVSPFTTTLSSDGNYFDYCDIIIDLLLWSGFQLWSPTGSNAPAVFGNLETTGAYASDGGTPPFDSNLIGADVFDKLKVIDAINKLKEVVGYIFLVDEEGGAHFRNPNTWQSGNYTPNMSHQSFIPVIDERVQLTQYTLNLLDQDMRSSITIANFDPLSNATGTVSTTTIPASAALLKGLVRPALWVNELFISPAEQALMAQLIARQIDLRSHTGSVVMAANPMLQIDDQVMIVERESYEQNIHYVRGIQSVHDIEKGDYTMTVTTNYLSSPVGFNITKTTLGTIVTSTRYA